MGSNIYFHNYKFSGEQNLIESLIIESLGIFGLECYYIPRVLNKYDQIYGEDTISTYENAYLIDMYVKNVEGFSGQGDFLSKFNIQIRDSMTLTVAKKTFNLLVGQKENFDRAREGDLIWFPLNQKIYVVKFVEHEAVFYQFGTLQTYDLQCDLFEYSNEKFNTGIPEIDVFQEEFSFAISDNVLLTQDNFVFQTQDGFDLIFDGFDYNFQVGQELTDNSTILQEAIPIVNFTEFNPFSE